ncbi:hypothetical protein H9P43_009039 [Blastocladiella emersonii ATCC 22665]|nr:hypothetical protein H9P43_009039 [Blastocladiella emersonii ATCC 22665]
MHRPAVAPAGRAGLALVLLTLLLAAAATPATACNGHPSLCDRPLSAVFFPGTHNSFAVGVGGAANQFTNITAQLNYGVRLLSVDIHRAASANSTSGPTSLRLCHGSCGLLDAGPATAGLGEIRAFLAANRAEVVVLTIENAAKAGYAELAALLAAAGLANLAYVQPPAQPRWPTLRELGVRDKRLLVFASDLPAPPAGAPLPPVMAHFAYISETPFELRAEADWTCALDRPRNATREMVLVNHWLYTSVFGFDAPSADNAQKVNGAAKMRAHLAKCAAVRKQFVNFALVDFNEFGDLLEVAAGINGVQYTPRPRPPVPPAAVSSGVSFGVVNGTGTATASAATPSPTGVVARGSNYGTPGISAAAPKAGPGGVRVVLGALVAVGVAVMLG